ncbi:hypothetical protein AB0F77_22910 [Streptomyces sp. NPDC026672]|uniref:hypothetical protein n=1 Tax=unclassified Streptomyces TaxID=2593676 RepID=UPI0033CED04C
MATLLRTLNAPERRFDSGEHVLGGELTLGEAQLRAALVQLDAAHSLRLDATPVHRITEHPHMGAYARRSAAHPASLCNGP